MTEQERYDLMRDKTPDEMIDMLNKKSQENYEHKIEVKAYIKCIEKIKEAAQLEIYCDDRLPETIRTYHIKEATLDKLLKELMGK